MTCSPSSIVGPAGGVPCGGRGGADGEGAWLPSWRGPLGAGYHRRLKDWVSALPPSLCSLLRGSQEIPLDSAEGQGIKENDSKKKVEKPLSGWVFTDNSFF